MCAYLALDMECLSEISDQLGDAETAATWRRREQELIERMIEHSYDASKGQFVSRISGTHVVADGDCVINYLPILLGNRLPKEIIDSLVNGLRRENRFLTPYGVASESVSSAKYAPDSYWRGPVWAPWTYFIAKGLREVGEGELAMEIVLNYMNNLRNTGFYENHNALTGAGQRDSILDWTAAVFLIMLRDFMGR